MKELWHDFTAEFCKVEFACWNGSPNWLGWIIIAVGSFALVLLALRILIFIEEAK